METSQIKEKIAFLRSSTSYFRFQNPSSLGTIYRCQFALFYSSAPNDFAISQTVRPEGFEPPTLRLRGGCSATELRAQAS